MIDLHDLASVYTGILRMALAAAAVYHALKRSYKPLASAAAALALTALPVVVERLFSYRLDPAGNILYGSIIAMTVYLGNSLKFYDRFAWWDYVVHFLSGGLFVSMGIALADKAADLGRTPLLVFSFALSLALHVLWEVLEYLSDCLFHTDNQRWQRKNPDHNHRPRSAVQPAGLLKGEGVDALICGGIGSGAKSALEQAEIALYGGVMGDADRAVADFLSGSLRFDPDIRCGHHGGGHSGSRCGDHRP